jgi:hypothetical protein
MWKRALELLDGMCGVMYMYSAGRYGLLFSNHATLSVLF